MALTGMAVATNNQYNGENHKVRLLMRKGHKCDYEFCGLERALCEMLHRQGEKRSEEIAEEVKWHWEILQKAQPDQ